MKKSICFLLTFIFCICCATNVDAQKKRRKVKTEESDTSKVEIIQVKLKNGNTLVGELIKLKSDSVVIKNEQFGRIAFAKSEIKTYTGLDKMLADDDEEGGWNKEKYQSQYLLSPTARPIGKGNSYYSNFNIFANTFSFGVSDNFSITAGFEAVSILAGEFPIVFINPKLSIPAGENLYFGVGTAVVLVNFDDEINVGGLAYANTTMCSATKNFTACIGLSYTLDGDTDAPLIYQLGFTLPLGKKVSILAESFVDSSFDGILNLGLRIITKSNIVFDAGITRPTGVDDIGIIGLPLLSLSVPF